MLQEISKHISLFNGAVKTCSDVRSLVDFTFPRILAQRLRAGRTYFEDIEGEVLAKYGSLLSQIANLNVMREKLKTSEEHRQVLLNTYAVMGNSFFAQ